MPEITPAAIPAGALRELAERELCRRRLIPFILRMYPSYLAGWVHKELAGHLEQFLDDVANKRSPRLMVFMPPRLGKSFEVSEMFVPWALGKHPMLEVVSTSYSAGLVENFSRGIRRMIRDDEFYHALFPALTLDDETQSVGRWRLKGLDVRGIAKPLGGYRAVGVGGGLTGFGADILVIDDPVANSDDANSEVVRENTWNWYATTARTRVMPGGGVLVVQCMTGDTPVLRPDGGETPLRDLRPGDMVRSYEAGKLVSRRVLNWQSSGLDSVLRIKTTCGRVVRANERHPFLVRTPTGETTWVRVKDLRPGDSLVQLTGARAPGKQKQGRVSVAPVKRGPVGTASTRMPRTGPPGTTGNTQANGARSMIASAVPCAKASAQRTTTSIAGRLGTGLRPLIRKHGERRTSSIATDCRWKSTTRFWRSKTASALSASNPQATKTLARTGAANYASTTATTPTVSGLSYVTTVTSQSVTPKHLRSPERWPRTSSFTPARIESITPDGVEEVFDIEVEETENFIADGLVSSNTRWHDDDLSGRIIELMRSDPAADQFKVVTYPAIAEFDEKYRKAGEALHPERYDERAYAQIRASVGPAVWNSLYQQNPVPDDGEFFKRDDIQYYTELPPKAGLSFYGTWDCAISQREDADPTCGFIVAFDHEYNIYVVDRYYGRWGSDEIVQRLVESQTTWKPLLHWMEKEKVQMALGPFIELAMTQGKHHDFVIEPLLPGRRDKASRARPLQGMVQRRKVFLPRTAEWTPSLVGEMLRFPRGKHDDQVDALAYAALNVNTVTVPLPDPKDKQHKSWRDTLMKHVRGVKSTGHMAS